MEYFWNWNVFFQTEPVTNSIFLIYLLNGILWTLAVAFLAWIIAFSIGTVIGTLRTIQNPLIEKFCFIYVEIFRNIPLLLQLFLWFYVFPEILPHEISQYIKSIPYPWAPFITAVICLGFFISSRISEITRSSISSIPRDQWDAAYSLGCTKFQTYTLIILPQAIRISIPPLTSEMLNTVKNTSLALTIGLMELMARARATQEFTFQIFESLLFATISYLLINLIIVKLMKLVEKKFHLKNYGVAA